MEHVNSTNARQTQHHHFDQQLPHNDNQQQFCLRWHNHQTSLLSTLPILLDQSHLTDVTISAEGRQLRAHRVVLSACSSFFMDIFRALEASNHPVIIIPGASFGAIVSLLTFMYSGEVNVYEEQIPMLLNLAETLGIKGLADVQNNNLPKTSRSGGVSYMDPSNEKCSDFERPSTPSPTPTPTITPSHTPTPSLPLPLPLPLPQLPSPALSTPLLANKLGSVGPTGLGTTPLENLFKSLQFYPSLLPQPLNFSQTALNKTSELLAKYQQQCQLYQSGMQEEHLDTDCFGSKRLKGDSPPKELRRLEKSLAKGPKTSSTANSNSSKSPQECSMPNPIVATSPVTLAPPAMAHFSPQLPVVKCSSASYPSPIGQGTGQLYSSKPAMYSAAATPTSAQQAAQMHHHHHHTSPAAGVATPYISAEDHAKLQLHIEQYQREAAAAAAAAAAGGMALVSAKSEPNLLSLSADRDKSLATAPLKPPSNSKLYATCFICHKQLSNQYNLRVHLETHQNVRYACNVCSHVSRSKDALRKHVSYRHPGAPSPCENEARRKRVSKLAATTGPSVATPTPMAMTTHTVTSGDVGPAPATTIGCAGQEGRNPYLFLPNQFQMAAAAAAVAVAESSPASGQPSLDLAHEAPPGIKGEREPPAASNGEATGAETSAATT
ncbi:LOW QUALITY PROTEIN: zinc finger and BTB domain-containing protein 3 [Drosophila gunungcola]|uniref:LOW QUALITY PROTEIN: zinc finger and BTB domain-containing protein 3 n=1 Tax=Drosophila gunungcola TaxID=103775 RepID=UPI0022E0A1ED|nr:LOW QUALITY PROTEIN: zinc finger and BTB domain-containing protein 3 [Drosophila gunungcola]